MLPIVPADELTPVFSRTYPVQVAGLRAKLDTNEMKAIWKGGIIADSETTVVVEGNHYFPAESVAKKHLTPSPTTTVCPWKGTAH